MNAPENRQIQQLLQQSLELAEAATKAEAPHKPTAPPLAAPLQDARYIGQAIPRPNIERLTQGRGQYVDDIELPRMAHVVFWRSPVAHARITRIERDFARMMPGVLAVYDGADLATVCKPWVATLTHLAGLKSAPQYPMAMDRACWQGEAVVAVVAKTRAEAEDALQYVQVEWEALPAALDMNTALDPETPVIHPELGDNLCFTRSFERTGLSDLLPAFWLVPQEKTCGR